MLPYLFSATVNEIDAYIQQNNQDKAHNDWHPTSFHAHACEDFQMVWVYISLISALSDPNCRRIPKISLCLLPQLTKI